MAIIIKNSDGSVKEIRLEQSDTVIVDSPLVEKPFVFPGKLAIYELRDAEEMWLNDILGYKAVMAYREKLGYYTARSGHTMPGYPDGFVDGLRYGVRLCSPVGSEAKETDRMFKKNTSEIEDWTRVFDYGYDPENLHQGMSSYAAKVYKQKLDLHAASGGKYSIGFIDGMRYGFRLSCYGENAEETDK